MRGGVKDFAMEGSWQRHGHRATTVESRMVAGYQDLEGTSAENGPGRQYPRYLNRW